MTTLQQETQSVPASNLSVQFPGPSVGIIQIDEKPATSVKFEHTEKDGQRAYTLTFSMDNKTVSKLKDLDEDSLEGAVGRKNAKTIRESESSKGTLKGSGLVNEYGLSPEENERRSVAKEERKQAQFDRAQPDLPEEINIVSQEPEREHINGAEAISRAARIREIERAQREQNQLGQQAEGKRITVENLSEKAREQDDENLVSERTGAVPAYQEQVFTEREKNRQVELMDQVHHQFRVSGAKFHFKDQPQRVAFQDKGPRMVSASNDERVTKAMATMAEAKGWKTIRVQGHPDFQREVWMEASLRGIEVRGFKPQEKDLKELEVRRDARSRNVIEHEPARSRETSQQNVAKAPERSDKGKVVEALAVQLVSEAIKDPKQRESVLKAINAQIDQRELTGKVPSVPTYDRKAPSTKQSERTGPQVEHQPERTR